uniref:Uncharacterized protein n=1 Tax=viral metagenome TaxID=1070528 RepID=A0A6C0D3Z7_9ZZZZ
MDEAVEVLDGEQVEVDESHESVNNANLIKDPNEIKKSEFVLNIQEIPNKKIAENYVKTLTDKLNKLKQQRTYMQFNFKMIVESDIKYNRMMGGGDENSTFPYNIFESTFDLITGKNRQNNDVADAEKNNQVSSSTESNTSSSNTSSSNTSSSNTSSSNTSSSNTSSSNKSIFENLFSYIPSLSVSSPVDLSFTMPVHLENLTQEPIQYLDDYDGVTHILVTIYDKYDSMGYIGGLHQLENWIRKKEERGK